MALLKADTKTKTKTVTAKFPSALKNDVEAYIEFSGLKSMNEFINKASQLVLHQDKAFKRWLKQKSAQ